MKQSILSIVAITILFLSCSKNSNEPPNNGGTATISYKVNDTLFTVTGDGYDSNAVGIVAQKNLPGSLYSTITYSVQSQRGAKNICLLEIPTDSLLKQTYHYDSSYSTRFRFSGVSVEFNGNLSEVLRTDDYSDITITDYSNGYISGNFSGKLTVTSMTFTPPGSTVLITDGKFQNVKVNY